jgi:membrane-associated phospholipid phosphatase
MPSGHIAFALTGAGLYCTQHAYYSQYDPGTERLICGSSIGVAVLDGVARLMADRHYATDVIAGSAIGLFSGFFLPRLLHYYHYRPAGEGAAPAKAEKQLFERISFAPQLIEGGGGLTCRISF